MAFKTGFSERLDELRFPSPRSPPVDSPYSHTPLSPPASMMSAFSRPTPDVRANLQRRFTTDAGKLSSWNFLNQQSANSTDTLDLLSSVSIASSVGCCCTCSCSAVLFRQLAFCDFALNPCRVHRGAPASQIRAFFSFLFFSFTLG